jgi:hypothetical protein
MEATLRSLAKAVRPFCEENDLYVNRKKLASRLPPARSQANNRKTQRRGAARRVPEYGSQTQLLLAGGGE